VPERTNTFQDIVALLHRHLAGDAEVEESAMLENRATGELREVDVVIRSTVAGQEMVLGVGATVKKGASPWVEQMIGKHEELPTNRLVLVSERGFSAPARRYAAKKGVALIEPTVFDDPNPALKIVSQLERVWPKGLAMTPQELKIVVRKPDGELQRVRDVPSDGLLYFHDGTVVGTHWEMFAKVVELRFGELAEMIGLPDIVEDRDEFFVLHLGTADAQWKLLRYGQSQALYLRWELSPEPEFHEVLAMEYTGRAVINVTEVRLTHRRFDKTNLAYGQAELAGKDALFLVTEDESGGRLSVRVGRDKPPAIAGEPQASPEGYSHAQPGEPDPGTRM
jgi:hypothetical protein